MREVHRVYCDMDADPGNFYLYHGNLENPKELDFDPEEYHLAC